MVLTSTRTKRRLPNKDKMVGGGKPQNSRRVVGGKALKKKPGSRVGKPRVQVGKKQRKFER